jgi:RNA exonuclease 4
MSRINVSAEDEVCSNDSLVDTSGASMPDRLNMFLSIKYDGDLELASVVSNSDNACNTAVKKRRRCRRRKNKSGRHIDTPSVTSCGNVSESSSEQSKRSLQRAMAQKKSKQAKDAVTVSLEERSQYLALDCEMVGFGPFGTKSTLARVTIVNWDGDIVYDQLIRPKEQVTDYRSFVSGITASDLDDDEKVVDLETCRNEVLNMLEGKIIIGHALKNDLHALKIQHPWQKIRDTAKYEPFMKQRFEDGVYWPRKLKELAFQYLNGIEIQKVGVPHSAYEDAFSAMLLYQTVRNKWEKVMTYKIRKTAEIEQTRPVQQANIQVPCYRDEILLSGDANTVVTEGMWPCLVSPDAHV